MMFVAYIDVFVLPFYVTLWLLIFNITTLLHVICTMLSILQLSIPELMSYAILSHFRYM